MEIKKENRLSRSLNLNILAILAIFFLCTSGGYEKSTIQICMEAWPDVQEASIRSLATMHSLAQTICMIVLGPLVGRKLKYRTACIFGALCVTMGGLTPAFFHPSWGFILMCRLLIGLGCGFFGSRNALLLRAVSKEEAAKWIGIGGVAMNISTIAGPPIAGALAEIRWNYAFLINIFAPLVLVILILFLKEPEPEKKEAEQKEAKEKATLNPIIIAYALIALLVTGTLYPLLSGMSTWFIERGFGSAAAAGVCISCYTVGGLCANLTLKKLQRLGRWYIAVTSLFVILGQALVLLISNAVVCGAGAWLCGYGFYAIFAMLQVFNRATQKDTNLVLTSTLILAASQLSIYLSSYWIEICKALIPWGNSSVGGAFLGCIIVYAAVAVVSIFAKLVPDQA